MHFLRVLWAAPYSLIGIVLCPGFRRRRFTHGVLLCERAQWPRKLGWRYRAITFGHVVLCIDDIDDRVFAHSSPTFVNTRDGGRSSSPLTLSPRHGVRSGGAIPIATTTSRSRPGPRLQSIVGISDEVIMTTEWDHSMRCPHCGGLNDLDAEWCMQCSRRLKPEREDVDFDEGRPGMRDTLSGALDLVAGSAYDSDDEGLRSAFALGEKNASWICKRCGYINDIRANLCADCGRPFTETAAALASMAVTRKQSHAALKALGIVTGGAIAMRLVGGLISPWAAVAFLGGATLRFLVKYLRP